MSIKVLYVFSGEQASGAEIVIEALMSKNLDNVSPHLFISPGRFAEKLIASQKPYTITRISQLRKLNRSKTNKSAFFLKAFLNYFIISFKTLKYIHKHQINIVHANTIVPASYLLPAILFGKIFLPETKWMWTDHDLKYFKKMDHWFANACCSLYNKTLVVSNAVKAKYYLKPKVEVLYNGLDTEKFKPDTEARKIFRNNVGINDDTILFAIAGIISPRKRQLELIRAFRQTVGNNLKFHLFLAGDFGPDHPDYNEQVKELISQQSNVQYIGHVDDMVMFYNGCDVIVNNSSAVGSEPFGATIYEAMSCGTVVMAANTGGLPEIVDHEINGFLFEPDNENALIEMIRYITGHLDNLFDIRKAGREKVKQKFGFSVIANQYNRLLEIPVTAAINKKKVLV